MMCHRDAFGMRSGDGFFFFILQSYDIRRLQSYDGVRCVTNFELFRRLWRPRHSMSSKSIHKGLLLAMVGRGHPTLPRQLRFSQMFGYESYLAWGEPLGGLLIALVE